MAILKSFKGYRPLKNIAEKVASRPYDVLNSTEARKEAEGNPDSFLHVVKPEIDLPEDINLYSKEVYNKGKENLQNLIAEGKLVQDEKNSIYIYGQTMWGKTQYGIVGCAGIDDYMNNVIKKHELTRPDKEEDRKNHIRITNINAEPVFFAFRDNKELDAIVAEAIKQEAAFDFTTEDEVGHHFWVIDDEATVARIEELFDKEIECTYVADGHHRTAAAALVGQERKIANPNHTGNEEYNYFLAVHFPESQLRIIDYNRLVKDLNGLSNQDFIQKLKVSFDVMDMGSEEFKPSSLHNISMYLDGTWYSLTAKKETYNDNDPIAVLDVTILTEQVLVPLLNIKDLRRSKKIEFVGGIRGLGELKRRVDSGEMKAAFALYPVSMKQLTDIADTNNIMPPKTTWFEPKLRSGLVIHELD